MEVTKVVTGVKRSRNAQKSEPAGKCKKAAGPRETTPAVSAGAASDEPPKQPPRPRRSRNRRNPRTKQSGTPKNDEIEELSGEQEVVCEGPKEPRLQYSRDELMALKAHPLSILRPDCFDPSRNKRIANLSCIKDFGQAAAASQGGGGGGSRSWERGKQDSPPPSDDPNAIVLGPEKVRKVGDPRERIRKEQDGIVLSPQRRSFNSGCFVPGGGLAAGCGMGANAVAPNAPRRPESPLGKGDSRDNAIREIPSRRIGSGRIMNRERESESSTGSGGRGWDFNDRSSGRISSEKDDFSSFRGLRERDRDERFERRSFGREFERNDKERRGAQGSRYGDRRSHKDDEPEWFSGGPTSQHDTIELHGFDEGEGKKKKKQGTPPKAKSPAAPKDEVEERKVEEKVIEKREEPKEVVGKENIQPQRDVPKESFNIEEFLKQDMHDFSQVFASGFQNEAPAEQSGGGGGGGSRFSRFFKPDSPTEHRRSSIQDEFIGSFMKELDEPKVNIPAPGGSEAYFAPISPAAAGSSGPAADSDKSSNLLAMLQRGQQQEKVPKIRELERSGRLHSVEELEAKMLQHNLNAPRQSEKDQEAFQKLFMQASQSGGPEPAEQSDVNKDRKDMHLNKPNPASRLSGRIISQGNKDIDPAMFGAYSEHQGHPHQQMHPPPQQPQQPQQQQQMPAVPQDVLLKLLELQQQQQHQHQSQRQQQENKMLGRGIFGSTAMTSPIPADVQALVHNVHPNHELLMRPEAQNIMDGLRHGKFTVQNLVHQLHSQNINPRIRETVAGVLKLHLQQQQARAVSPHVPPMHQQMRITSPMNGGDLMHQGLCPTLGGVLGTSPVPPMQSSSLTVQHSGIPHRVPSPHELILHTRQIMQNALLKKKLEEQSENYHRKQERQRAMSPANVKPSSSSPLAFTPTSVLRKMTAEKDFDGGADAKSVARSHMQLEQHSNWKPIEPIVPKPHQGRPIVKGSGSQQQPPYNFPPEMGRVPQPNMMGMQQRMMGAQKIGPQNSMQQQAFMDQQNVFPQQNRDIQMENSGSSILLQQLLSGQRSINSINMAQQQPHGVPRPLRGQQVDGSGSSNLSQWFSGAGQMGVMPPIPTSNTFSVEELERRQQPSTATPVHN
ncbi:eukaryotic translation initiation factor 4E transporter-like isoform X2 [Neocloeon triangulifer]|uniref:eukaryotic translation initiation factor 4E transporter-like isoform X2 n=1 Tax=Neocloeon triangulifer TaxID=2078957 RepID=UPI00286F295C|nr:eukaryotic translation initiation factor 4E transporter-like isoform X2 [Neocloeon triangulifer]